MPLARESSQSKWRRLSRAESEKAGAGRTVCRELGQRRGDGSGETSLLLLCQKCCPENDRDPLHCLKWDRNSRGSLARLKGAEANPTAGQNMRRAGGLPRHTNTTGWRQGAHAFSSSSRVQRADAPFLDVDLLIANHATQILGKNTEQFGCFALLAFRPVKP
jgi:hypothetical protein